MGFWKEKFVAIYKNMTTTQNSFQNFLTKELISSMEEILHSFHTQKKRKIYFFAESHLDFLFLIQGGNFHKRVMGLYRDLRNENLPIETCIFIYLLFSEKKMCTIIFDSKKKTLLPVILEEEVDFGENPYRFLLTYLKSTLEEAHEDLNLSNWSKCEYSYPSV
jgi:hypothetical protein